MSRCCLTFGLFLGLLARSFSPSAAADATPPRDPNGVPALAPAVTPPITPAVPPAVRQAMQDRDYARARKAIDEAAKAKDAPRDYLAYLRAWSHYLDKQYDQAIAELDKFEKDYPQSAWLRRARFAKAQAMVGKGDFRGAQSIYESEAKYLLSDARRQQSAEIYLEFADSCYQPPRAGQSPDYNAARQFYAVALDAGLNGPRRAEAEFRMAICLQRLGQFANAAKGFEEFVAKHAGDARQPEVRYRLGECLLAAGQPAEARKAWQELLTSPLSLRKSNASAAKGPATRNWAAEAAFHLAETWHCPQPRDEGDLRRGVAALRDFLARFPGHELAGQAHLEIAAIQISRQHYDDAIATLQNFLRDPRWKDCKELPDALRALGSVYLSQNKYAQAVAAWREYLARYSAHEGWNAVQQSIIDAEYATGLEKFKSDDYDAATRLWTEFLARYPLDARNPGILFLFGEIQQRQKKWEAAVAAWKRLAAKYPHAQEAARAEAAIARTLDEQLGRYDEARAYYKKVGDAAAAAAISARQMLVETERVFRSDETPRLQLATRNVSSVKVRVYKIDLETYFRKMHTVVGIERLDVSLIDPDATFDFAVPGFARYKPLTSFIPVPLQGLKAGVAAVTVTSPTQEATTLVIQSDLEIVLRASHGEALVFAQNMRTGKPWRGVRLLLSDGKSVFAEGKTGDGGFYSRKLPDLADDTILRVFAAAEGGHVASTALHLAAGQGGVELSDRIFLVTDRAAYRAGEPVHVRGGARRAVDGRLAVEPGKKLSVELHDSADRRLRRLGVTLSALGTFACDFPLPARMPEGGYSIVAGDDAGRHRTVPLEIEAPPVESERLEIVLPRKVYYRGESIEGTIRAILPEDRRLIGTKVEYSLGSQPAATATTDTRGEARFSIATGELEQYGAATVSAAVPARSLAAQCGVTIATRGFSIGLSTVRPVFIAGEGFDVKIKTRDAADQPAAQKLLVKVSRQAKAGDATRDEPVEEHPISTAADGTAKLALRPAKGGQYTISASGTDRFGNAIERSLAVRVSDDGDSERLLLLADRIELKAGDTADVQLYWRGEPATAVVTTHYDRLREHRVVELHKGFNRLAVPITAAMAPGFTLGAAVMDRVPLSLWERAGVRGNARAVPHTNENQPSPPAPLPEGEGRRLYEAECDFIVDPDLQVKLECHRHGDAAAKPRPGEPIDVTVSTCDAQGKPVAADVSLSVLPSDRAAGEQGPHGALPRFALGHGHAAQFQTASSIQFHYRPFNRTIAADVPDAEAAAIPPHIMPQIIVTRSVSEEPRIETRNVSEEPSLTRRVTMSPPPAVPDEPSNSQADFQALQEMIQKSGKAPSWNDDPFAANPAATPTAAAARKPASGDDPFSSEPVAQAPAANEANGRKAPRRQTEPAVVTRSSRPSWLGYWNPSIPTGPGGRATVTIAAPADAAELTLAAQAIAAGNLAGQTTVTLALKKPLSAELHLPPAFTDGDEVEIPVVIHNDAIGQGKLTVELSVDVDVSRWTDTKTIDVKTRGRLETSFKPTVRLPQRPSKADGHLPPRPRALVTVTTKAAGQADTACRSVPVLPYGAEFRTTAAGAVSGDATFALTSSRPHWTAHTLQIALSPSIQRGLLDMIEQPAAESDADVDAVQNKSGLRPAGDLMAALALCKLYPPQSAEARALDEKIRENLCLLIAAQQPGGGWLVHGRPTAPATNAVAYWSLVSADKAGFEVPRESLVAAFRKVREGLANDPESDLAGKAILLHALALSGQGDFSLANQLLRDRKSLAPLARAYLALALVRMDRRDSAADVLKQPASAERDAVEKQPDIEAQAVTALARLALDPASPQAKSLVESVLARRQGLRWCPEGATGPAVLAAAEWLAHSRASDAPCRATITVNDKPLKTLDLDPRGPTQVIDVPASLLVNGKQTIAIHATGTARIAYRATLCGVEPAEHVAGSSAAWHIERAYEPPLMDVDGQKIPRGFTSLSGDVSSAAFSNRMTQLPATRSGLVQLTVYHTRQEAQEEPLDPVSGSQDLTIVEPLPSGAAVVPSSLEGAFDRAEILPGRIVFHLHHRPPNSTIRYELQGVFPGADLVSPALLLRAGRDAPLAATKPKSLVVLPQGVKSSDPYRLSPDELLALGRLARQKGDATDATRYFGELLESWHGRRDFGLDEPVHRETVVALMQLGMGRAGAPALGAAKLVQYCETIKEKWPLEPVTLEQLLTAAGAYREIGEVERSYTACRAAVEGSFTRECGVAGFLENQGRFLRSVGLMERLVRDYPPEPYVAEAQFDLAQRVYAKAGEPQANPPQANQPPQGVGNGNEATRNGADAVLYSREALIARAGEMLQSFLTGFPNDPAADQAAFAAANAQLDLKHYAAAADIAAAAARRYPKSELLDSYWYMLAYCDFALGKYPAAIDMCRKVADAQRLDKDTGRMVESQNKYRAIYILGQIYQSLGRRADAIREYRRVEDRIPDAKSSVAYFVRKEIALPECTTLKPGAAAEVPLRYRNIAGCDVKVYRVDLVKFCEAGQALGDLSRVNLSGIRPLDQSAVALAGGGDFADHQQKLTLPIKKEGAYLVVCRGEDLYASGLLLISPLGIEQQVDVASGQLRIFVTDAATGRCAGDAQIKLLPRGANVQANVAGTTDLRGVFTAACPPGGATIVAQAGPGQYAYVASPPLTAAPREAVVQSKLPDVDPTAPFETADFGPLVDLIKKTVVTKSWLDNGGNGSVSDFPTNLRLEVHQGAPAGAAHAPTSLAGEETPAVRKIREALASPTPPIEFTDTSLKDVIEYLKDSAHIEIQLDTAGLKDAGVDPDQQVTKNIRGMSLRSALKLLLDDLQLKYVIHNEVLLITSPTKAESDEFMETKAYPVTDLVLAGTDGAVDFQPLMDLLQNTVATKSWIDNGGNGTISDMIVGKRALLVTSQTQEVHEQIADMLETLRKAGGLKSGARKLAEQEQSEDETDLPARPRLHRPAPRAMGQGFGGMGGVGMGGMGRGMGGKSQTPFVISVIPVGDADLLGGLRSSNAANQQSKVLHLKQRQDAGQNQGSGMGGMGGMGGGFF